MSMDKQFVDQVKNSRDFTGKVVLVTGSSANIGKQTAKLFAALGASVVITGRRAEEVHKVADEAQGLSPKGIKPLEVVGDLSKAEDLEQLFNKTIAHFGKLDVLVNNAGCFIPCPVESGEFFDGFDKHFNTDVKPSLKLIQLSIPYLKQTKGSIINVSTIFTRVPQRHYLSYTSGKATLETATKVLAQELGPFGVRVNCVSPGVVEKKWEGEKAYIQEIYKHMVDKTPMRRLATSEDLAKSIVFLASSDASYITGINIDVDGGLLHNIGGDFMTANMNA